MKFARSALLALVSCASFVLADDDVVSCSSSQNCPEDKPCCSLYGECGTGSYCVGPCNPKYSYNLTSCAPAPICQSGDHTFNNQDRIVKNTKYLGDADAADFVVNNDILSYDDSILLTMSNGSTGTVLTSTRAIWYGKVSATLKTSRTQGVVSSFILMSGVRDEIDYEFIGSFLETAQTNYYWQETLDYQNSRNISLSDTFENYHTYEIDWTPDSITWSVDGQSGRVLNKNDTYNDTTSLYQYPQTPSFIQISLWPGGLASNAEGTINWAGGEINWDSDDIKDPGYFYVTLKDVSIECYDPPSGTTVTGNSSYVYSDVAGLSGNVEIVGNSTVLGSFDATGFDMDKGSDSSLEDVSGSVPTGVGSGNNHSNESDSTSSIPDASAISSSTKSSSKASSKTSSESLADVTGTHSTTSKSSASSTKDSSSASSTSKASAKSTDSSDDDSSESTGSSEGSDSAAASTTSASESTQDSGFVQASTTGAAESNGASKLVASVFGIAGVLCVLML